MSETTEHPTLSEFLLARIAEDEARWVDAPTSRRMIQGRMVEVPIMPVAASFKRDRKRWLAECEAKRRIIERHTRLRDNQQLGLRHLYNTLLDLASVYADHADYREEWRP